MHRNDSLSLSFRINGFLPGIFSGLSVASILSGYLGVTCFLSGYWVNTLLGVIHFFPSFSEITPVTPTHGWPHMQPGTSFEPFTPFVAISPGAK